MTDEQDSNNGASGLLGLFAPPTPPANHDNAKKARKDDGGLSSDPNVIEEETPQGQTYQSFDMLRSYDDIDNATADKDAPLGSISYMMGLFSSPSTAGTSNESRVPPGVEASNLEQKEITPLLGNKFSSLTNSLTNASTEATPKTNMRSRKMYSPSGENGAPRSNRHIRLPSVAMPVIEESVSPIHMISTNRGWLYNTLDLCKNRIKAAAKPTTLIGAFMYLLYHVVFCLALGSAINRPHSSTPLLGLMTKVAALGTISASSVYWWFLSSEIPALYPAVVCIHEVSLC